MPIMKTINQLQPGDTLYMVAPTSAINGKLVRKLYIQKVVDLDNLTEAQKLGHKKKVINAYRIKAVDFVGAGSYLLTVSKGADNLEVETVYRGEITMVFHTVNNVTLTTNPEVAAETATRLINERIENHIQAKMAEVTKKLEDYREYQLGLLDAALTEHFLK